MVFSQTDANPQSILKVVELNRLKNPKVQNTNGTNIVGGSPKPQAAPVSTTSFSEIFLKPEPQFESTMFHESDSELFRDLAPWCVQTAEGTAPTGIDGQNTHGRAPNTDTLHTPFSPQGWDNSEANSPGFNFSSSAFNNSLSPNIDMFPQLDSKFVYPEVEKKVDDLNWVIEDMPIVIVPGNYASEESFDWIRSPVTGNASSNNTHEYTSTLNTTHSTFIMDEDSSDRKLDTVVPTEVECNKEDITEYTLNEYVENFGDLEPIPLRRQPPGLSLNVTKATPWTSEVVSTPDIVDLVTQMDKESFLQQKPYESPQWPSHEVTPSLDVATTSSTPLPDYEPITPKTESPLISDDEDSKPNTRKRRLKSEDSDEPYTPYSTRSTRKTKRRKVHIPIKDLIQELEQAQPKEHEKPKRGRPPKRRDSTVSSAHSVDDNSSTISTHEIKYRELRDKNNEASKRSRMNRKLKELQMEQLATELEERNKKLRIRADILEDMTKRMKEALMAAILNK